MHDEKTIKRNKKILKEIADHISIGNGMNDYVVELDRIIGVFIRDYTDYPLLTKEQVSDMLKEAKGPIWLDVTRDGLKWEKRGIVGVCWDEGYYPFKPLYCDDYNYHYMAARMFNKHRSEK